MTTPKDERWLVLAAAEIELAPLRAALAADDGGAELVVAGVGTAADPVVEAALDRPPGLLLNLGLAGGLSAAAGPGRVVLTTGWVHADSPTLVERTDGALRARVRSWLEPAIGALEAPGITVEEPLHDPAAGERIHRTSGAVTVEMEGERWARLARAAGWRAVALRVISDRADLALPLPRHELLTANGGVRIGPWLRALATGGLRRSPIGEWRALRRAQRDWRRALVGLAAVSSQLGKRLR